MAETLTKNGRPPKYGNAKVLSESIKEYFDSCENSKTMPNKAGLCCWLKISRETWSQYRAKFPDTVKTTDHYIENIWVQRLAGNSPTGAIFYLKNAFKEHYKDRNETDLTSDGKSIQTVVYLPAKSNDKGMEA